MLLSTYACGDPWNGQLRSLVTMSIFNSKASLLLPMTTYLCLNTLATSV